MIWWFQNLLVFKFACFKFSLCRYIVAQWRRRNVTPAWHRWVALHQSAMDKHELAAARWFRVSAASALHQWRGFATDSLRLRSWEAFVVGPLYKLTPPDP